MKLQQATNPRDIFNTTIKSSDYKWYQWQHFLSTFENINSEIYWYKDSVVCLMSNISYPIRIRKQLICERESPS